MTRERGCKLKQRFHFSSKNETKSSSIEIRIEKAGRKAFRVKLYKHCTLSSLMASSFFSSALVGSFHAVVNPIPLGEDGGLLPFIRRPNE